MVFVLFYITNLSHFLTLLILFIYYLFLGRTQHLTTFIHIQIFVSKCMKYHNDNIRHVTERNV